MNDIQFITGQTGNNIFLEYPRQESSLRRLKVEPLSRGISYPFIKSITDPQIRFADQFVICSMYWLIMVNVPSFDPPSIIMYSIPVFICYYTLNGFFQFLFSIINDGDYTKNYISIVWRSVRGWWSHIILQRNLICLIFVIDYRLKDCFSTRPTLIIAMYFGGLMDAMVKQRKIFHDSICPQLRICRSVVENNSLGKAPAVENSRFPFFKQWCCSTFFKKGPKCLGLIKVFRSISIIFKLRLLIEDCWYCWNPKKHCFKTQCGKFTYKHISAIYCMIRQGIFWEP